MITTKVKVGTSLVAQWLRIRLPTQGTRVRPQVWEDPTCCRATKPMRHNYWACALEPASHDYGACVPQLLKPACLEPVLRNKEKPLQWEAGAPQRRVAPAPATRESPRTATKTPRSQKINKQIYFFLKSHDIFLTSNSPCSLLVYRQATVLKDFFIVLKYT